MINFGIINKILGSLLFIEASLMVWCLGVAFYYNEDDIFAFGVAIIITVFCGFILKYLGRNAENRLSRRDSFLVVTLAWVLFSLFGTIPFLVGGYLNSFTDAYFETMSGFTTTGATIIDDVEQLPHGILFWRSLTQWIGGLGIVFFTIAIIPSLVNGSIKVFSAEATGPIKTKLHPKLSMSAKWIWMVYLGISVCCLAGYKLCGMTWFEAINFTMTSTATGGFSIYNSSTEYFNSPAIDYVTTFFCFLSGVNFTLLYFSVAKLKLRDLFRDSEFRLYITLILCFTAFISFELITKNGYSLEHAFRSAIFQVVSFITTTGLFNDNAAVWPHVTWVILAICMFVGACAGSTSGGFKCVRVVMLLKITRNELRQRLHPNAVLPVKVNGQNITDRNRVSLLAFLVAYLILALTISVVMIYSGIDNTNAVTITLSCLGNVGPTLGTEIGPTMSWSMLPNLDKWFCSIMMLFGRLEIFTVVVILTPAFWKEN
ncbi:MAG: TrkH family potassium uptake protein [Prevotella sp.]|jgi:trk system potassium uptake protein TrkH